MLILCIIMVCFLCLSLSVFIIMKESTLHYPFACSGSSYSVRVRAAPQHVGSYHCPVMFHVSVERSSGARQTAHILRYLHCRCRNSLVDSLQPTSEYKKPPRTNKLKGKALEIVPGYKAPRQAV